MKGRLAVKMFLVFLIMISFFDVQLINAQPGTFVKGVLQPLADGFPNHTINIIVVDDPGSFEDIMAKSYQAALKGISPVPITVTCEPSPVGGNWYAVKEAIKREGGTEGYYPIIIDGFGVVQDLLTEPGTKEIGAKLSDLNMVITTDETPYVVVQRKNAPWGPTFAGLMKYGKENPGKLRYISFEVGTGFDFLMEWIMRDVGGLNVQKIPQGPVQQCVSTVGAGEGDFTLTRMDVALTNWQAGRVDPILVLAETVPEIWRKDPNVVTTKMAGLSPVIPNGMIKGVGVPSQVPQSHVDWLNKLFNAAANTELYKNRTKVNPGLAIRVLTGESRNAAHKAIYKTIEPIVRELGLHIDDVKK